MDAVKWLVFIVVLFTPTISWTATPDYCQINADSRADSAANYITTCGSTWTFVQFGHSIPYGNGCAGVTEDNDGYRIFVMSILNPLGWDMRWVGTRFIPRTPTATCGQTDATGGRTMSGMWDDITNFGQSNMALAADPSKTAVWLLGVIYNDQRGGATTTTVKARYYALLTLTAEIVAPHLIVTGNETRNIAGNDIVPFNTVTEAAYNEFKLAYPSQVTAWVDAYTISQGVPDGYVCASDLYHFWIEGYQLLATGIAASLTAQASP